MDPSQAAAQALLAFPFANATLTPITMGHINQTFRVDAAGERYILQRLNPIFGAQVNLDLEALTQHLVAAGLASPTLVRTRAGEAWHQGPAGEVWRALTFVPGEVYAAATDPSFCHGAGVLLGRFHRALSNVQHTFHSQRFGVHDTPRHLAGLQDALATHAHHEAYDQVAPLADEVFAALAKLPQASAALPERIVHGDAKLSNVIFAEAGTRPGQRPARALVDLDTLAPMQVHLELGDAFRSWCNPAGEGPKPARFHLDYLGAACTGYAQGAAGLLGPQEVAQIAPAIALITLELAARFLRDALEERYFSWDSSHYGAAWQHHLVRAKSQLGCHASLAALGAAPQDVVAHAFGLTD